MATPDILRGIQEGTRVFIGRVSYQATEKDVERFFKNYGRIREMVLKNGYGFIDFDDRRDADDAVHDLNGKEMCGENVVVEHARGPSRRGGGRGGGRDYRDDYRGGRGSGRGWQDRGGYGGGGGGGRRGYESRGYESRRGGGGGYGRRDSDRSRGYGAPQRTDYSLLVENLSSRVSWQDLKDYMRQAGEVTYAEAHKDHMNEGIVEFASYSDMKNALEKFDGKELNGRRFRLSENKPSRRSRSRSRSSSRSRSRSRNRSRSRDSRSRSRSRSKDRSRSKSRSRDRDSRSRSRSRSRSKSP